MINYEAGAQAEIEQEATNPGKRLARVTSPTGIHFNRKDRQERRDNSTALCVLCVLCGYIHFHSAASVSGASDQSRVIQQALAPALAAEAGFLVTAEW